MTLKLTQERTLHTPRYVRASCVKNLRRVDALLSWLMELTGRERQTEECGCSCDCDGRERLVKLQRDEIRRHRSVVASTTHDLKSSSQLPSCAISYSTNTQQRRDDLRRWGCAQRGRQPRHTVNSRLGCQCGKISFNVNGSRHNVKVRILLMHINRPTMLQG